ncbi:MAG: hypothetical protein JRN24_02745 [Nitrososphaerota archaeon]|nr:hypothetical protein [Nitrososphaerota archaeon]
MAGQEGSLPLSGRFGHPVVKDGCGVFGVLRKPHSPAISNLVAVEGVSCIKYRGSDLGAGYAAFDAPRGDGEDRRFRIQAFVAAEETAREVRQALEHRLGYVEEEAFKKPAGPSGSGRLSVWEASLRLGADGNAALLEKTVDRINQSLLGDGFRGRIFSYGNYLRLYKGVGFPLEVAKARGLDGNAVEADLWLAHTRQPTNSPGTLPIWSHPFASMNAAIVHNGDISSYGANMELLGSWGLTSHVGTDSEVIARLLDHLVRAEGLTVEEAATVLTNPLEQDATKEVRDLLWRYRGARLDGPFAVVGGYADSEDLYLIALSDRSKFRPLLIGEDDGYFYVASEENQIRNRSPDARVWTPEPGSFFIASLKRGIIAAGRERSLETQTLALGTLRPRPSSHESYRPVDARGLGFREINEAIVDSFRTGEGGVTVRNCACAMSPTCWQRLFRPRLTICVSCAI